MAFPILGTPRPQFSDSTGVLAAGTVQVLNPTTGNDATYYPTADDADAGTNPQTGNITLNANGMTPDGFFGADGASFKITVKDADGATVWTEDDIDLPVNNEVSAKKFGAVGDGSTDDTEAIQAAIDHVSNLGGGRVILAAGIYKITSTLDITAAVILVGDGSNDTHSVGDFDDQGATIIRWGGSAGGTMIRIRSATGASSQKIIGGGLRDLVLHSNYSTNAAGIGVRVTSVDKGVLENVFCYEFSTAAVQFDCLENGDLGDEENTQQWEVARLSGRQINAGGAFVILTGNSDGSRNSSMNEFRNCDCVFDGLTGVGAFSLRDCDNNLLVRCRAVPAASGDALVFYAAGGPGFARDNTCIAFSSSSNGAIVAQGTETAANFSRNNVMIGLDTGNSTPEPTLGTSATLAWTTNNRRMARFALQSAGVGNDQSSAQAALNNIGSEALRINATGAQHVRLVSGSDEWAVDVSSGNLRVNRVAGSGVVQVNNETKFVDAVGFANNAPITQPGVSGSRGGNAALASLLTALESYGLIADNTTA